MANIAQQILFFFPQLNHSIRFSKEKKAKSASRDCHFHPISYPKLAFFIAMRQKGLQIEVERPYEVVFRGKVIGRYIADLVVSQTVIVEL